MVVAGKKRHVLLFNWDDSKVCTSSDEKLFSNSSSALRALPPTFLFGPRCLSLDLFVFPPHMSIAILRSSSRTLSGKKSRNLPALDVMELFQQHSMADKCERDCGRRSPKYLTTTLGFYSFAIPIQPLQHTQLHSIQDSSSNHGRRKASLVR